MAYEHLYQRRRTAPQQQAVSVPQPVNESFVEHQRRLHPVQVDASAGLNEAERADVREWRRLLAAGLVGFGTVIPQRLLAAVMDGVAPQNAPFSLGSASDPVRSIAAQVDKGLSIRASLATDHPTPRRDLATDQDPHRPTMSYKLSQVMGDYSFLDEDSFDAALKQWGVVEPRDRIALKSEALALRKMRARGTPLPTPQTPRRYIPAPHVADPTVQHFVRKDSKEAQEDTGGRPDTPGKKHSPGKVQTMQACTSDGFACYDKTSISL